MFGRPFGLSGASSIMHFLDVRALAVAAGKVGGMFQLNNIVSLFQDSAGTTPVTVVEQPVGLALDSEYGLARGPELVSNGMFNTDTAGWSTNSVTPLAVSGGRLVVTSSSVSGAVVASEPITLVVGKAYEFTCNYTDVNGDGVALSLQAAQFGSTISSAVFGSGVPGISGNLRFIAVANASSVWVGVRIANATAIGNSATFDNVSVKLLDGNHATQATAAARPVLSSRVNLLTKSELISDAVWFKSSGVVTGSNVADENGNLTLTPTSNNPGVGSFVGLAVTLPNNCIIFRTVTAKKITGADQIVFEFNDGVSGGNAGFNLVTGAVSASIGVASIVNLGNGFWECTHTFTTAATGNPSSNVIYIGVYGATATPTTIAFGKVQVSLGSKQRYQRVNTATDYDTAGFPKYLKFDGVDDSLSSSTGGGGTAGFFFCAAVQVTGGAGTVRTLYSDHTGSSGYVIRVDTDNTLKLYAGNGTAYTVASTGAVAVGTKYLMTGFDDGVNISVQLDSGAPVFIARPTVLAGSASFSIGKANSSAVEFLNGNIYAPVYVRNTGLTAPERADLQAYVRQQAGL